jgi:membrane-associated phospholipid phosphatase
MRQIRAMLADDRNGRPPLFAAVTLAAALAAAHPAGPCLAQPVGAPASPDRSAAPPSAAHADGRRTMRRLPANLGRSAIGVFHKDNLGPLVAGSAATGLSSIWDDVRQAAQPYNWGESLETAGGPIWSSAFVASMFTAGRFAHGPRFRAMTYDMLDAAIVNLGYTELLKAAVGRERPNGQDNKSFPSGHTSNSFALAAVAERHYGWKLGVPAYLAASLVGASRIQQDKHHLSDVVAGATLGYIVGRTVVRVNNRPLADSKPAASLDVASIVAARTRGLRAVVSF